ncbi:MAG TPA: RDD family protein, partial [Pyrinomonadaceae bacterium]|nr:RDD family protein [Pyrinomonadaceae bacterium]
MRCPSCGALQNGLNVCVECGQELISDQSIAESGSASLEMCAGENRSDVESNQTSDISSHSSQESRLIEFPGVARSSVPLWRKEIAERVREAQERKARETSETYGTSGANSVPQLELLSQTEAPELNPLVAAALKRIERAHANPTPHQLNSASPLAAVAYAQETTYQPFVETSSGVANEQMAQSVISLQLDEVTGVEQPAKTHSLVVVPTTTTKDEPEVAQVSTPKPRRIIRDDLCSPALNYLDSVPTSLRVEDVSNRAPVFRRMIAGVVDLFILFVLCLPLLAGINRMELQFQDPQVGLFVVSTLLLVGSLYSTVSTALTGRTLGMRLLKLRVVDSRTGLIPTGSQSAGRSLLYLFSLISAGLLLAYALLDADRRTAHDKFTKTDVIAC